MSNAIEDSVARNYYIKDRSYTNNLKPPIRENIIYKLDTDGSTLGYWYAIIDWHIVDNEKSLYDLSEKYKTTVYQAIRINSIFNKPFKSSISDYYYKHQGYRYVEHIFNIDYTKYSTPDINAKKMKYYQKNNFINQNYIYNGQLLYFYK